MDILPSTRQREPQFPRHIATLKQPPLSLCLPACRSAALALLERVSARSRDIFFLGEVNHGRTIRATGSRIFRALIKPNDSPDFPPRIDAGERSGEGAAGDASSFSRARAEVRPRVSPPIIFHSSWLSRDISYGCARAEREVCLIPMWPSNLLDTRARESCLPRP